MNATAKRRIAERVRSEHVVIEARGVRTRFPTLDGAEAAVRSWWPAAVVGHDGDIRHGGDRTLVWECVGDSIDDDGKRAIAEIRHVSP